LRGGPWSRFGTSPYQYVPGNDLRLILSRRRRYAVSESLCTALCHESLRSCTVPCPSRSGCAPRCVQAFRVQVLCHTVFQFVPRRALSEPLCSLRPARVCAPDGGDGPGRDYQLSSPMTRHDLSDACGPRVSVTSVDACRWVRRQAGWSFKGAAPASRSKDEAGRDGTSLRRAGMSRVCVTSVEHPCPGRFAVQPRP
jgi:hypothetical protein